MTHSPTQVLYALAVAPGILVGAASLALGQPIDGPLGVDHPVASPKTTRRAIAHTKLPITLAGDYVLDPAKTADLYGSGAFGTVPVRRLRAPVRDQHYVLARGTDGQPTQIGLRMIPVSDPHVPLKPGEEPNPQKPGSHLIDRFIRKTHLLKPNDPIFALVVHMTPYDKSGKAWGRRAMDEHTHASVYLGQGYTRSSPETYHNNEWQVQGYPATVQLISMEGTNQAILNRNGHIAAAILNPGVVFPYGPQPDQAVTLARTLAFYRGWLKDDPQTNNTPTSSAEHVAIITNVMLNVPHNAASFSALWRGEGAKLLALAKAKYQAATGQSLIETSFQPLWRKDKIANPTASAVGLGAPQSVGVGRGLAWAPQHAIDQLENGLELYASWPEQGARTGGAALMRLAKKILARMRQGKPLPVAGQSMTRFVGAVIPQMFVHEAMTKHGRAVLKSYLQQPDVVLYVAAGGDPRDLSGDRTPSAWRISIVEAIRRALKTNKAEIVKRAKAKTSPEQAYALFQAAIADDLRAIRKAYESHPQGTRYESTDTVTQRVATGLHPGHSMVKLEAVATVFEAKELISKEELAKRSKATDATDRKGLKQALQECGPGKDK